jgi:membrane fusion protein
MVVALIMLCSVVVAATTNYTRTLRAPGFLLPSKGQNRITPPPDSRILKICKQAGDIVEAGECLFTVTRGRNLQGGLVEGVDESKIQLLQKRISLLNVEKKVLVEQCADIERQLSSIKDDAALEFSKISEIEAAQQPRAKFSQEQYQSHQLLARQGFISSEALKQKLGDQYDLQRAEAELARDKVRLMRSQREAEFSLRSDLRSSKTRIVEIERQSEEIAKDILEAKASVEQVIVAPRRSEVAAVYLHPGDYADTRPAMLLAEAGDVLEVSYWIDSTAVPYFKEGVPVKISVKAFPAQRYGYLTAHIDSWSQAAPASNEEQIIEQARSQKSQLTLFRFKAVIDKHQEAFKAPTAGLKSGMDVEVLVPTERFSVLTWLIDPAARLIGSQSENTSTAPRERDGIKQPPRESGRNE